MQNQIILLDYTTDVATGICRLIAAYFAFNIAYPGALRPILIFLQHVMLGIVDKQSVPALITRVYNSITKTE